MAGWDEEAQLLERAVAEINRLRPAFAIVCGDLVTDSVSARTVTNLLTQLQSK